MLTQYQNDELRLKTNQNQKKHVLDKCLCSFFRDMFLSLGLYIILRVFWFMFLTILMLTWAFKGDLEMY